MKDIRIEGEILLEKRTPLNAKIKLLNKKHETIAILDSTLNGKFLFLIDKKFYKKECLIVISEIGIEVLNKSSPPKTNLKYVDINDTIPVFLDKPSIIKNINVKGIYAPSEIIHKTHH